MLGLNHAWYSTKPQHKVRPCSLHKYIRTTLYNAVAHYNVERTRPSIAAKEIKNFAPSPQAQGRHCATPENPSVGEGFFFRLKKWWVGKVVGSPSLRRKWGVIIVIHKNIPYTLHKTDWDNYGCRVTITLSPVGTWHTKTLQIANIYALNSWTAYISKPLLVGF